MRSSSASRIGEGALNQRLSQPGLSRAAHDSPKPVTLKTVEEKGSGSNAVEDHEKAKLGLHRRLHKLEAAVEQMEPAVDYTEEQLCSFLGIKQVQNQWADFLAGFAKFGFLIKGRAGGGASYRISTPEILFGHIKGKIEKVESYSTVGKIKLLEAAIRASYSGPLTTDRMVRLIMKTLPEQHGTEASAYGLLVRLNSLLGIHSDVVFNRNLSKGNSYTLSADTAETVKK